MIFSPAISPPPVGSSGGITFKGDRGVLVGRARAMPVDPLATRQSAVRPSFSGIAQHWKLASSGQQSSWDDYAAAVPLPHPSGGTHFVSGFAMFCRSNFYWLQIANFSARFPSPIPAQIVYDGPTTFDLGESVASITAATVGSVDAELFGTFSSPLSDGAAMLIYAGRLVNESRDAYYWPFQLAFVTGFSASSSSFHVIVGDYTAPDEWWSALLPASGQYQALRFLLLFDDGRLSLPFETVVQWV